MHQCRDINCYYEVWILCENCDLRINNCLSHVDVLQNSRELPEDGVGT